VAEVDHFLEALLALSRLAYEDVALPDLHDRVAQLASALERYTDAPIGEAERAAFAALAAATLHGADRHRAATAEVAQLKEALQSRATIDQAKGILMAREGVDPDTAFEMLRFRSQHENRKLRDLATELVASTQS
jgi:hypothetical protein